MAARGCNAPQVQGCYCCGVQPTSHYKEGDPTGTNLLCTLRGGEMGRKGMLRKAMLIKGISIKGTLRKGMLTKGTRKKGNTEKGDAEKGDTKERGR